MNLEPVDLVFCNVQEASENSLVKQFGFQPVSGEGRIAQVDWTPKVINNKLHNPEAVDKGVASVPPICARFF